MSASDPDLVSRGQAIFDRLRSASSEDSASNEDAASVEGDSPAEDNNETTEPMGAASEAEKTLSEPAPIDEVTASLKEPASQPVESDTHTATSASPAPSTGLIRPNTAEADFAGDGVAVSGRELPLLGGGAEALETEADAGSEHPISEPGSEDTDLTSADARATNPELAESERRVDGPPFAQPADPELRAEPVIPEPEPVIPEPEPVIPEPEPVIPEPESVETAAPAAPARHPAASRPLPRTIAIANQKGGVGKTTTTVNLGAALAELGFRVLVIDLDPQGNATTGLGINSRNLESSIYDVLLHDTALDDCIEPTSVRNLFVAPATIDLAGAEIELVPAFSRELRLRRAIESLDGQFDFTIIDCPPSLGLITVNGLAAATEIIVPIQCEYYALEGLGQLLKNVTLVQGNLNPRLEISAIVLTMYDARTRLAEQVAQEVREHFGDRVCRMVVPRTVRLSEAPSFGQPIITFDPSSRGAIAYRELAKEVSGGAP